MRKLWVLLITSSMLAACSGQHQQVDANKVLNDIRGPEIQGVDATMLSMAKNAEAKGDWKASAQLYQQMLDKDPKNTGVALAYGESLRRSGQADQALQVFNHIVAAEPNNQDALEGKGLSELSLADTNAASQTLTKVMSLNPNRWRTLNGIGVLFAVRGMTSEALQYMNAALKINPNSSAVQNNKGLVAALDHDFPTALKSLFGASSSAKTPAQQTQADLNAALVYAIAGDLDHAEQMAKKHLEGPELQNNLGQYALLANNEGLARTHLQMALSESKTFYEKAWNNLADLNQSSQTGQVGSEKRVDLSSSEASKNSVSLPLPAVAPSSNAQSGMQNNSASYTQGGVYGQPTPSEAPAGNTQAQKGANGENNESPKSNGFEALGDFLTNW